MKLKFLLQHVQDAFSIQNKLTTFITDCYGELITSVSNSSELVDEILQLNSSEFKVKLDGKQRILQKVTRSVIMDAQMFSNYIGLKLMVAPIKINGHPTHYIWAGMYMEQGYKNLILQNISKDSETYKRIHNLDEFSFMDVEERINALEKFVSISEELIASYDHQKKQANTIRTMTELLTEKGTLLSRINMILNQFKGYEPHIDFVVFANCKDEQNYEIVNSIGQFDNAQLTSQFMNDMMFRQAMKKKEFSIWSPKSGEGSPKTMFYCPFSINDGKEGFVFGGCIQSNELSSTFPTFCSLIREVLHLLYKVEDLEGALDRHLMRMSALLEMSNAMNMMKKKDDVLHMLVDIALELFPGNFCSVTFGDAFIYNIPSNKIEPNKLKNHFYKEPYITGPQLLETEWGMVLQYPLINRKRELGTLTIHLANMESIKESEVILTRLVSVASEVLDNLGEEGDQPISHHSQFVQEHAPLLECLTVREIDVLHHLAKGYSNREIAEKLNISTHTVKNHISNIFQKIGVSDRSQLIAMVYQLNTMNLS